jgi:hypothetical protein
MYGDPKSDTSDSNDKKEENENGKTEEGTK